MNARKKVLLEAKPEDKEVIEFIKRATSMGHPFVERWMKNYEAKVLKESPDSPEKGALRGQTVGDAYGAAFQAQVAATLEIFNAVIRGYMRYMDDSWVKKYVTESVVFKIPLVEYRELAADISPTTGQLPSSDKRIDYATIDLSNPESEKGAKISWTRALLEDVTFDVQGELLEGLGHDIAVKIQEELIAKVTDLATNAPYKMPYGAVIPITSAANGGITWSEFLSIIGAVDTGFTRHDARGTLSAALVASHIGTKVYEAANASNVAGVLRQVIVNSTAANEARLYIDQGIGHKGLVDGTQYTITDGTTAVTFTYAAGLSKQRGKITYGPADVALVSPDIYWELLNIIQLTNVLYEGSTDPVNQGKIKLALGCTIIKHGLLPARTVVALNSAKGVGLVMRRQLKIEPVLFPVWNEYGFIGTVRFGSTVLFPGAIQVGQTS